MPLLQSFWHKLKKPVDPAPTVVQSTGVMANPLFDYDDLLAIQNRAEFIRVVHNESGYEYQSLVVAINLYDRTMEIDELFPNRPEFPISQGDTLTISHGRGFESLTFSSEVIGSHTSTEGHCYLVKLPKRVQYLPRRRETRLTLSREKPVTVKLLSPIRTPCYATADNLSCSGMRLVIGGNLQDQLRRGAEIPLCEFKLLDTVNVRCKAHVRDYRFYSRPYRRTELSIEFTDMAPDTKVQIKQFVDIVHRQLAA